MNYILFKWLLVGNGLNGSKSWLLQERLSHRLCHFCAGLLSLPLCHWLAPHKTIINSQSSVSCTCLYFSPRAESLTKPRLFLKYTLSTLFQNRKRTWTMCSRWWHQLLTGWTHHNLRMKKKIWSPPKMYSRRWVKRPERIQYICQCWRSSQTWWYVWQFSQNKMQSTDTFWHT